MNDTQAFPNFEYDVNDRGMTLRDYFAAAALQGLLADPSNAWEEVEYAEAAYIMADAMLESRK